MAGSTLPDRLSFWVTKALLNPDLDMIWVFSILTTLSYSYYSTFWQSLIFHTDAHFVVLAIPRVRELGSGPLWDPEWQFISPSIRCSFWFIFQRADWKSGLWSTRTVTGSVAFSEEEEEDNGGIYVLPFHCGRRFPLRVAESDAADVTWARVQSVKGTPFITGNADFHGFQQLWEINSSSSSTDFGNFYN